MKHISYTLFLWITCLCSGLAQQEKYQIQNNTDSKGYEYISITNDPLQTRIYKLKNGLTVYLSPYKDAPRIQTYIAVRAGSKNDPSYATGLAHYLEHILFKGTSKIGTQNWEKEKPLIDQIEATYETYRNTRDPQQREKLYARIDSLSLLASTYSIANEYDKLLSSIGAKGTNAYTFVEQTVYVNDIPSNQIDKWAKIEAERFGEVVPRLFHTELEAVYEEKNKGMDQDRTKVWETMLSSLFPTHPYGTQTTIGTIEHLKNPSITEIKKYFYSYYVPNNVAICMSGDLEYESTIQTIDKYFGSWKPKEVPDFDKIDENSIKEPIVKNLIGPDAENVTIAFRLNGYHELGKWKSEDVLFIKLLSQLLANGEAGLIDLNLNQEQKILGGYAYDLPLNDYSIFSLGGKPREGQSLEQVKDLLLAQLDSVKQGKFDAKLIEAVMNNYKIGQMREYESNRARADAFVDAFISRRSWDKVLAETDRMESITKEKMMAYVQYNFNNNYVVIYKRKGIDSTIQKVPKPKISSVELNRDKQSEFLKTIQDQASSPIEPVFLDFNKDLKIETRQGMPLIYRQNTENELFTQVYYWNIGRETNPLYGIAGDYLDYLGTDSYSPTELKKEFYRLGCSYSITSTSDAISISLSGLQKNYEPAVKLLQQLLQKAKPDQQALNDLVDGILKVRKDNKLNKDVILRSAMLSYAKYGPKNPFTNTLSEKQLKALKASNLTKLIASLNGLQHRILYYGPMEMNALSESLIKMHWNNKVKPVKSKTLFTFREIKENEVYFVDYNMVQAEMIFLSRSVNYNKDLAPDIVLFNEYFGGSMNSVVFQELRESRALAYAVRSRYESAAKKDEPNYINSYIGTQADKCLESIEAMIDLHENMPVSENLFQVGKSSLNESLRTTRVTKYSILTSYLSYEKLGLKEDLRKAIFQKAQNATMADVTRFQQQYLKGQKRILLVIGSKDRIDLKKLEKYGKVKVLSLEEIFGY